VNLTYEKPPNNVGVGLRVPPLKDLNPVRQADILHWTRLSQVSPFITRHEIAISKLTSDPSVYLKPGEIHMQHFVDAVRALIPGP
jgi:hypothetical protein